MSRFVTFFVTKRDRKCHAIQNKLSQMHITNQKTRAKCAKKCVFSAIENTPKNAQKRAKNNQKEDC